MYKRLLRMKPERGWKSNLGCLKAMDQEERNHWIKTHRLGLWKAINLNWLVGFPQMIHEWSATASPPRASCELLSRQLNVAFKKEVNFWAVCRCTWHSPSLMKYQPKIINNHHWWLTWSTMIHHHSPAYWRAMHPLFELIYQKPWSSSPSHPPLREHSPSLCWTWGVARGERWAPWSFRDGVAITGTPKSGGFPYKTWPQRWMLGGTMAQPTLLQQPISNEPRQCPDCHSRSNSLKQRSPRLSYDYVATPALHTKLIHLVAFPISYMFILP